MKLFTGQMPFLSPTDSVEALKEEVIAVNTRFMHCVSKKSRPFYFYDNYNKNGPIFVIFHCYTQQGSVEEDGIKTTTRSNLLPHYLAETKCSTMQLHSTVNSVRSNANTFNHSKCSREMLFLCLFLHFNGIFSRSTWVSWFYCS